jgi:hypothetical protein
MFMFVTLFFDGYWLYDSISVDDYSPFFGFLILFVVLSGLTFYALIKKLI